MRATSRSGTRTVRLAFRFLIIAAALGAAELAPSTAAAQSGAVTGRVVEAETGRPLGDVQIFLQGTTRGAVTDADGRYRIGGVPAGRRVVVAERIGYRAVRRPVQIDAGDSLALDFELGEEALPMSEIVVAISGEAQDLRHVAATVGVVGGREISEIVPSHPSEVMGRIPGVWVNVTGGEGHMTAIRQPKTTNPVYLYLEDGVPTRSTGFFNHNALYEVNLPQADRIEVLKGPSSALYGSDAIGGVIDVGTSAPPREPSLTGTLEGGEHGWGRLLASAGTTTGPNGYRGDLNVTRSDGWRDGTGYDRWSGTMRYDRTFADGSLLKTVVAYSAIDQQTAGSSAISLEDFQATPEINYTPISYRNVRAFRASAAWEKVSDRTLVSVTPFARVNSMEILPNWSLTFDPAIWDTGHNSLGLLARVRRDFDPLATRLIGGVDVDWSPGYHDEWAIAPVREGKIFTRFERGESIYEYDVTFTGISPYLQAEVAPVEPLHVTAGLRFDALGYDYDNQLDVVTEGRHRRPPSTDVSYTHLSPKLGATWAFGESGTVFAAYSHGFRAPSEGQLFRQGQAVNTVDLDPVKADQMEVGARVHPGGPVAFEASVYRLQKTDDVLSFTNPDGSTETVNAGETLHRGVELAVGVRLPADLRFDFDWSYAKHTYEEWTPRDGVDLSGNEMEDAPRTIGNAVLAWSPAVAPGASVSLEWVRIGSYWMDADNTHEYDGHDLLNLRARMPIGRFVAFARLMNAADERYAESAGFNVFRGEEFAPGAPRTLFAGVQIR